MTRRDARIMARRLRRGGWRVVVACGGGVYWLRVYRPNEPGAYVLVYRGPRNASVLAWLGLSPGVPERPDMSPAKADPAPTK